MAVVLQSQPVFAFREVVQRTPEQAVDDDHEQTHHRDAEHDAVEIARFGRLRDIGAEPDGLEMLVAPATRPRRRCWRSTSRPKP